MSLRASLEHYLLSNLSGRLVANRQSAFAAQDFQEAKKVFREDLTISVDGTRPYRYSSYRCTGKRCPPAVRTWSGREAGNAGVDPEVRQEVGDGADGDSGGRRLWAGD